MVYRIIKIEDTDLNYPRRLLNINDHPKVIYAIGNIDLLNKPSIAIVGSRDIDGYGIEQTSRFSDYLSKAGFTIVSGLAKGVDTYAHINSMKNFGKTIAVLPAGFKHIYPKENIKLVKEIIKNNGLVISEYGEEEGISKYKFIRRNRIISGISLGTLVVEAAYKSGSITTANYAINQGREVFSIPGDCGNSRSYGTNNLICDGANLVISPKDILDYYKMWSKEKLENIDGKISVGEEYKEIYNLIDNIPISQDEISKILKLTAVRVSEILLMLELDGFIKQEYDGRFVRL